MIWIYSNDLKINKNEFMSSNDLQSRLSNTLNHFPILSGRMSEDINENGQIHLTNDGVLFTESKCLNKNLDYFINRTNENKEFDYENINSSDLIVYVSNDWTGPMLSIQITRLICGSLILSISAFHCLMDAQSISHFMNCWASVNGETLQNNPMTDKTFILLSPEEQQNYFIIRPSDCVYNRNLNSSLGSPFVRTQEERIICKVYYFSMEELIKIKEEAMKDLSKEIDYISTYDALYAHLIIVIAEATQTSFTDNNKIKILQPFNGRSCFSPPALDYFGAFTFWLYSQIPTDREVNLSSLSQLIHQMYSKQNQSSLKFYNAYLLSDDGNIKKNQLDADISNKDFHCTSWRKFHMLEANFDGSDNGYPIFIGPSKYRGLRYSIMMDANRKDQSINVIFGLKEQDYKRMTEQNFLHKYRENSI
jgi:hypothetical protein